ncbi:YLP motif-containing protein 1 isoform X1 [Tenrec ecaudatus]|uniref:YLP motif-containing protein 1 isoform X1 n=1 Tax=Tenrec ecaudatus TaxID=94439 RepID=UPI003F5926A4
MYPNWGRYGGSSHYPPPPVPPPPPVALPEASPGPGYSSSTAPSSSGFMSFREQHLAQLQQLQQMHQKQMQCVLQPHHLPPPPMPPPPVMPGGSYGDWQPPPPPMPPPPGPALSYQKQQQYKHQMLHHQRDGPPALVPMELDSPPESPPVPPGSYMPPSQPYMPPPSYYPPSSSQSYPPPAQPSPSQSPPPQSYLAPTSYSSSTTSTSTSTSSSYLSHSQAYLPSSQASPSRPSQGHPKSQPQAPPPPAGPSGNKAPVQPEPSESGPKNKSSEKQQATSEPDPSKMTPQEQQQYWYRQHLLSLQQRTKARLPAHRKGPAVAKDAPEPVKEVVTVPAASQEAKPPSSEEPPLPPSGEEVPPPLPPEEPQSEDPEEDARLKQLQAAAAHWQQHQQHRVGLQYQGIMQKHTQLQQILQQYQQMIQQPPHIQTMSLDMQLRHYEMQQQQFQHLYQDWEREFQLWEEQLHSYPHKDQLQEYEKQWKTWQGHMKASQNYLQEKVNALQNMKNQYMGNMSMPPPFAPYSQMPPPPPTMPPPVLPPSLPPPVMPPALPATVPPPGMPPPVMPPSLPTSVPPPGMPPSLSSAGPPPGLPPPSLSTTGPPPVLPPPSLSSTAPPPVMPLPPLSSATPPPGIPPPGVPQGIPSQLTKGLPASSSQSSQVPEKPRPALLPTPVSFGSGPPSAYHSPMQSDQMNSKAPLIKSAPPYSSFSSEQGLGDSSAVSTGVKDMPVRSGGLLPDPPRSSYLEGPRGPRFDGPRRFEDLGSRCEGPRPKGPRFEGNRPDGPRPRYEGHSTEGTKSKWGMIPRGPASQFYITPNTSLSPRQSGPQWRGPKPPFGQQHQQPPPKSQAEPLSGNKEPLAETNSNQQKNLKIQSAAFSVTADVKDAKAAQSDENLSDSQQEPPKSEGSEGPVASSSWDQNSQRVETHMDKAHAVTQSVALANKPVPSQSALPSKSGGMEGGDEAVATSAPLTADNDFNSLGIGLPAPENNQEKGLPHSDNRENRLEGSRGSSSSYRGPGRMEDTRDKGLVNRGRGQAINRSPGLVKQEDIHDKMMGRREDSREKMSRGEGSRDRGLVRPGSSREKVPGGLQGSQERGRAGSRERGPPRGASSQERGLPRRAGSRERIPPPRRAGSRERGPPRGPGSRERGLGRPDFGRDRGSFRPEPGDGGEKMYPYHRDEPPRAPWNHGEERGHEEFPLDGRSAPMERERLDDWDRDRYWRESEPDYQDDTLDPYNREDRFSAPPSRSHDGDRRGPWWDDWERDPEMDEDYNREMDRDMDRIGRPMDVYDRNLDNEWDRDYGRPLDEQESQFHERDIPSIPSLPTLPPLPPLDRYRDDRWREERNRDHGHGYDRDFRDRGELRIREYPERGDAWRDKRDYAPDRMDWERERLSDRWYTSDVDRHSPMAEHMPSTHHSSEVMGSDANLDSDQGLGGVMVLSQRQHEIILKAAQELKMLREQKEQLQKMKAFGSEPQMPDHPPPQDSSRLQSTVSRPGMYPPPGPYRPPPPMGKPPPGSIMRPPVPPARSSIPMNRPPVPGPPPIPPLPPPPPVMKSQASGVAQERWDEDSFYGLWDTNDDQGLNSEFKSENTTIPSGPVLPLPPGHPSIPPPGPMPMGMPPMSNQPPVQQTVDYGHGRDMATNKVEQIPYGERVTLRPDPVPERSTFETDHTGQRDRYDRDRDREPYFDRQSNVMADHRDFKRDRETHRDRDRDRGVMDYDRDRFDRDRRSRDDRTQSYRDKKDHSSSRRGGFDRPSYDRKSDRPAYEGPSMFGGERRTYPEERMPLSTPALSHQPPPAPRVEKKPESKNVDDILKPPGRESRPERIVVIMRGLPGSGKTHVAKLIRDKEVEFGGPAPRVLSLDDYFIAEVEKEEKDPDSGKKVKKKVMEYEYEAEMEETYRTSMFKAFKKTLDDGFFPFIILDAINDRVRHFDQFWSAAKTKGFEVYLAEMSADNQTCGKRNIHGRKLKEINKMADHWETAPRHMMRLDIRSLLQDAAIEEVEMEDFDANIEEQKEEKKDAEEEESELGYIPKSKWEMDTSEAKLDKLDGLRTGTKRKRDWEAIASRMEDYLQLPDDYDTRASEPGKKRVRWADLEEKKDADRKRAIGFVVGQTDWEKITDESGHLAEKALNRTKYI